MGACLPSRKKRCVYSLVAQHCTSIEERCACCQGRLMKASQPAGRQEKREESLCFKKRKGTYSVLYSRRLCIAGDSNANIGANGRPP
jgi:hypothetical protein